MVLNLILDQISKNYMFLALVIVYFLKNQFSLFQIVSYEDIRFDTLPIQQLIHLSIKKNYIILFIKIIKKIKLVLLLLLL